jgi:lysine 2,3-aminomutase
MTGKPWETSGEDFENWRWQVKKSIHSIDELPSVLTEKEDCAQVALAARNFPMRITPYYLSLMNFEDPDDPLRKMAVPAPEELLRSTQTQDDPIEEEMHSPLPGVIRRYPDRALLLVSNNCAVNCRHCTRRQLGSGHIAALDGSGFGKAIDFLRSTPAIRDVIISGGDPLMLDDERLKDILQAVRGVPTIEIIRIGTRVPVTLPMRVSSSLARLLKEFQPLYVNTQFNHPREVTSAAREAVGYLIDEGIPVANQAVLLRGVNDDPLLIEELSRTLLRIRVRPYYLFVCDPWPGIEHLRTHLDTAVKIARHLRGRLSGLGIPQVVVDLPGGHGKVPVGSEYVIESGQGRTVFRAPNGELVVYPDPVRGCLSE